jgi:O-antigen/teichoic acid export membrane protein
MTGEVTGSKPASLLGRMLANTAWLLGSKGVSAVCSLIYLAILARSLGLREFGHFSLILGSAQALVAVASFQTWRVVLRYGAAHVHARDWNAFGRLGLLAGLLDLAGALLGVGLAWIVFYPFASALDLNPEYRDMGFLFACAMLFALNSAPSGIVRALDRFDISAYVETIVPLGRLAAAVAIWLTGPTLAKFLIAWAAVGLAEAIGFWIAARRLCPQAVAWRHFRTLRRAGVENPGVGRFFLVASASATLEGAVRQGPLLAVGYLVDTRTAGLFRLASQLSQALGKLSVLLTRAAYAEINRARVAVDAGQFRKLVTDTSLLAAGAGAVVMVVAMLLGQPLLVLIGGEPFVAAYSILLPLTAAACFELASVAFEPVLHSTGRARYALAGRSFGVIALAGGIAWFASGDSGVPIALAVAVGSLVSYLALGAFAWRALRATREPEQGPAG